MMSFLRMGLNIHARTCMRVCLYVRMYACAYVFIFRDLFWDGTWAQAPCVYRKSLARRRTNITTQIAPLKTHLRVSIPHVRTHDLLPHTQAHLFKKAEEKLRLHNNIEVWWPRDKRSYGATIMELSESHIHLLYNDGTMKVYTLGILVPRIAFAEVRDNFDSVLFLARSVTILIQFYFWQGV